jgi:hypothetical protein
LDATLAVSAKQYALEAYGWNAKDNLLEKLLELNLELAEREKRGEATPCGYLEELIGAWAGDNPR